MVEELANLVGGFGGKDVLELAGLLLDFGFAVHGKRIGEQALGQAVAADDVGSALMAARGEFDDGLAIASRKARRLQSVVARIDERLVIVRFRRMRARRNQSHRGHFFNGNRNRQSAVHFHSADLCDLTVFFEDE